MMLPKLWDIAADEQDSWILGGWKRELFGFSIKMLAMRTHDGVTCVLGLYNKGSAPN